MRGVDAKVVSQVRREGGDRGECLRFDNWAEAHLFPIEPHLPSIRAITVLLHVIAWHHLPPLICLVPSSLSPPLPSSSSAAATLLLHAVTFFVPPSPLLPCNFAPSTCNLFQPNTVSDLSAALCLVSMSSPTTSSLLPLSLHPTTSNPPTPPPSACPPIPFPPSPPPPPPPSVPCSPSCPPSRRTSCLSWRMR